MLTRKLALGLVFALAASITGCKCCGSGSSCSSSPLVGPAPCSSCGTPGAVPPPGAVVAPVPGPAPFVPPPAGPGGGPYGASYPRNI